MFGLGYAVLGKKFAMSTLVSTFSYPVMLGIIQKAAGSFVLTDDLLLSALFGELYKLERIVYSIDPDAFVVMSRATSVHGKGFSKAKEYIVV